jgi:hypothetical protein
MNGFVEQLRLAEKAAEDIYFSKVDCELIEDLHKRMQAEKGSNQSSEKSAPKKYCGILARLHTEADVKSNTGTKQLQDVNDRNRCIPAIIDLSSHVRFGAFRT